ncbi:uncharacterized protein [Leptinotarsa decemlineata]|uniref:uncharacterized protein n=1 Tax=Leptinotarsa decemlineata TaxID=7539 RepID=UPI003D3069FF
MLRRTESGDTRYFHEVILKLANKGFYVDNCVTSVSDELTLNMFLQEATMIMAEGKFDLRGWEFTRKDSNYNNEDVVPLPVLGLMWDPVRDTLNFNPSCLKEMISQEEYITKRIILSMAQRVFDPIGSMFPATLVPKLLLQEFWNKNLTWDEPVDEDTSVEFRNWFHELPSLLEIAIPRWVDIVPTSDFVCSIHTFCDTSNSAYSAVIFLRVVKNQQLSVHLLAAKSRLAPIQKKGKMLLAATIGARFFRNVIDNFEFKEITSYFWSDLSTVISWIQRKEEWATFVWT